MCGYTVLLYKKKKKLSLDKIEFLKNSQYHRGPDTKKYLCYSNIYFFHNRLKIIDLKKKSDQPFVSKVTGNVVVFNGEIYNFIELKKRIKIKKFYTSSDTEVLLYLYEQEGENFFKYLNGIFSFVIYDKKKNILLFGRDRFGVKPIYSYLDNEKIILSTEIKPILYLNNNKFEFNLIEIKKYLSEGLLYNKNQTFFKNILLENSSTYKIFSVRNFKFIKKKKYWYLKKQKKLECSTYTEFYKKFVLLFNESLRLNIVSNVEVAILLSSGLDSYFLKCFFEKNFKGKIKTFTFGWKNKKYDEILKIKKLIKPNKRNLFKRFSGYKILKELQKIIYFSEGPVGGFGTASVYLLMNFIKKKNIKVLLSGEGADEIFLGYYNFKILFLYSILNKSSLFDKELKKFNKFENKKLDKKKIIFLANNFFEQKITTPDGYNMSSNNFKKNLKKKINLNKFFLSYIFENKLPKLLMFLDKCSGANGVESRVPFLDHNLVTFIYSNPNYFKFKNGVSKFPMIDWLDKNKFRYYKKKLYVSTDQREFFKKKKIYNKLILKIKNGYLVRNGLVNFESFQNEYRNYLKKKKQSNSFFIWKVLNVELFFEAFLNLNKFKNNS